MWLRKLPILVLSGWLGIFPWLSGCDRNSEADLMVLHVWAHAGQEAERQVLQAQIERYNLQSDKIQLKLTFIPERDYNAQVQAAASHSAGRFIAPRSAE